MALSERINLQEYCIKNHMEYLLEEWDKKKNGNLTPENITAGNQRKVWWILPYDDKKTGRHFDFSWKMSIWRRTGGSVCPYLTGKKIWKGFNDLATTHPELAAQWHPVKNRDLKPKDVTAGSQKKVWWLFPYDDSKTGKHFDFEWESQINNRANGADCPYISGRAVWRGFNDLATTHPELAAEWDYEKNKLLPSEVTARSGRKVWWKCSICGHKWKTIIFNRTTAGCPECAKELRTSFPEQAASFYLEKHFPDTESGNRTVLDGKELDVYIPSVPAAVEYDGVQYHKSIRRDLDKNRLCMEKGILLIRIREEGCPAMEDAPFLKVISCAPRKEESLADAICQAGGILGISSMDVDIGRDRQEIYSRYIKCRKENSLAVTHPDLAAQWHPTKNVELKPSDVTAGSGKKVWWLLTYDDPKTGKHFNFLWQAAIASRVKGAGCPFLTGHKVWKGFNDLATTHPELAAQWHPIKNGDLKPSDATAGSSKRVWWLQSYDDEKTGRHFSFEWMSSINHRVCGAGCPYLSGKAVWRGFNDLETYCKENGRLDILSQWNYEKNGSLTPSDVTAGSNRKVWWIKDGKSLKRRVTDVMRVAL